MKKNRSDNITLVVFAIIVLLIVVPNTIYRFKHPELSQTELFKHLIKSTFWNFK